MAARRLESTSIPADLPTKQLPKARRTAAKLNYWSHGRRTTEANIAEMTQERKFEVEEEEEGPLETPGDTQLLNMLNSRCRAPQLFTKTCF